MNKYKELLSMTPEQTMEEVGKIKRKESTLSAKHRAIVCAKFEDDVSNGDLQIQKNMIKRHTELINKGMEDVLKNVCKQLGLNPEDKLVAKRFTLISRTNLPNIEPNGSVVLLYDLYFIDRYLGQIVVTDTNVTFKPA